MRTLINRSERVANLPSRLVPQQSTHGVLPCRSDVALGLGFWPAITRQPELVQQPLRRDGALMVAENETVVESAETAAAAAPAGDGQAAVGTKLEFQVIYGKLKQDVSLDSNTSVGELKDLVEKNTQIARSGQKILVKGKPLTDDNQTLEQAGIKSGAKLMLIGTPAPQVAAAQQAPTAAPVTDWDAGAAASSEPLSKQTVHAKVIAKGVPEDAMPGIKGKQVPLPDEIKMIPGLLNSHSTKCRITFKEESGEMVIATATYTQRLPYASVKKIEATPIEGQEEYSIITLELGSGKMYLYFFPSQYTAGFKIRVLGVESLL